MPLFRSRVLLVALVAAAACSTGPSLPEADAEIVGTLTEFLPGPASLPASTRVLVTPADPSHQTIVHVEGGTRLYILESDGDLRRADVGDLATGDELEVWTTGIELRSYPSQVFATRIHILR